LLSFEDRVILERAISSLRELEQQVLLLFHVDSLNQTEIAAKLNISGNYVSHILRQSLSKLRAMLDEEERLERILHRQASALKSDIVDEITGAYTETYLSSRLAEECQRAACDGTEVAFIQIRFDGLDTVRRFYGAQAVDDFLADAALFLRSQIRGLDLVGRIGPTGFGIILPSTGEAVQIVKARLAKTFKEWLIEGSGGSAGVSVAMGESWYPKCGRSASKLWKAAVLVHIEISDRRAA
jgi:diguanylate cyclase (GGDEF)-like protein